MAKKIGLMLGVIFVVVGLLGFISNPIVGEGAYFETDMMHNIVHLVTGAIFIVVAGSGALSGVLKLFGIVYLLVAVLGFMSKDATILGLMDINSADNWLHVVLGVVLLAAGFKVGKSRGMPTMSDSSMGGMNSTM